MSNIPARFPVSTYRVIASLLVVLAFALRTAPAQDDPVAHQLATLPDTFGNSLVTVVKETEMSMGGLGAMFGGGDGQAAKTRVVGVVVGDNLIMTPQIAAEGPGGMFGGLLEQFAGQITMETKDLGSKVIAPDGEEYDAELIGDDEVIGVAFWKITGDEIPELTPVTFPAAPRLALGDRVIGLSPLAKGYSKSIACAISRVNAVRETPTRSYETVIPIGRPGSLVVNAQGAPVGVILPSIDLSGDEGMAGMFESLIEGMAPVFPADHFNALILNPPVKNAGGEGGGVEKPWLGIKMQAVPSSLAEALGLPTSGGISITQVHRGYSAADAGLREEDILIGVDGEGFDEVESSKDLDVLRNHIARRRVGDKVKLDVWRDGERLEVEAVLKAMPVRKEDATSVEDKDFELTVRELTYWDRQDHNLADDATGVVVKKFERAGWAGIGGVKKGDIILKIGDLEITGLDSFKQSMAAVKSEKPHQVVLYVQQGVDTKFLEVEPSWPENDEGGF